MREDDYHWLRDEQWQAVLANPEQLSAEIRQYIEAENTYTQATMQDTEALQETLYWEMRGRICEAESTVPLPDGPYEYFVRYDEGCEHEKYMRQRDGVEECLLDVNRLAEGADYCEVSRFVHPPCHRYIAYSVDTKGSELYDIHILDTDTKQLLPFQRGHSSGHVVWSGNSDYLFYVRNDVNCRPYQVYRASMHGAAEQDVLVYEESDPGFFLSLSATLSGRFITLHSGDHTTDEVRLIDAYRPLDPPILVAEREAGVEYELHDWEASFFVLTNRGGVADYKLMMAPIADPRVENWRDYYVPKPATTLLAVRAYRDHLVVIERANALPSVSYRSLREEEATFQQVAFDEPAYALSLGMALEYDSDRLRFSYESMTTPEQQFEVDLRTGQRRLLKAQRIPSGHEVTDYVTQRLSVPARDGALVPVSLLWHRETTPEANTPLMLQAYGAYGECSPASFSSARLSLVDRGWVVAIAHVRGGMECGYGWYTEGKLAHKQNTFSDFIDVGQALHQRHFSAPARTVIQGGSAGGMLIGAVLNQRPELWQAAIADVPFVDVLNTMCDASLPLTPIEWPEWGHPTACVEDYHRLLAYSPYDNVQPQRYPHLLVLAGLCDPRVTYWESAKWVAKLRQHAQGGGEILLKTQMEAGHAGASGRFEYLREIALKYAFALKMLEKSV